MKRGYYEYDPVLYPRKLWVTIGLSLKDIRDVFSKDDGGELEDDGKEFYGVTFPEVCRKEDLKYGELVCFKKKADMTMMVVSHEASHVCDAIEDTLGITHGDEPSAYLLGWIASCINKARLGIGDFVEIKDKEE